MEDEAIINVNGTILRLSMIDACLVFWYFTEDIRLEIHSPNTIRNIEKIAQRFKIPKKGKHTHHVRVRQGYDVIKSAQIDYIDSRVIFVEVK